MKKEIKEIIEKIKDLGWSVSIEDENIVSLGKFSPQGQDFSILVDTEDDEDLFIENIYQCYSNFDVSYETYLWLDDTGHGASGSPYDMRDLYDDMEACQESILELYNELIKGEK